MLCNCYVMNTFFLYFRIPKVTIIISIILLLRANAEPDGHGCGEEQNDTPTTTLSVTGLSEKAENAKQKINSEAASAINSIRFDTEAARGWLLNSVEGKGWTAQRIAKAIADMIAEAEAELNNQVQNNLPKMVQQASDTFSTSIDKLDPKVKFQADLVWKERCCDEGSWSDSAANKMGVTAANGGGKIDFAFEIGASAGIEATTQASLSVSIDVGVKLSGFNPVRPKSGTGSSITIKTTPTYEWDVKASGGGGVMLKITVGGGFSNSGTLNDVSGTLTCK